MQATADALAFQPPPEPAAVRGFVLAVLAHLALVVALSLGINWDKDTAPATVEAELWSALPQEAAPPPVPEPPQPVVQPPPVVQAPPPPVTREPDIAIEREKNRKEEAKRREEELRHKKELAEQKRKLDEQRKLAEEKKHREEQAKLEREAKLREQARKDQLARIRALAGGGAPTSQGSAQKSSGPSDSYAGRIRARVKPNIVFSDDVPGNPSAEVEVRMAPDGTIVSRKITKASGVKSWDDAVLRALDKTEILPRDVDGRVHTPLIIAFKLRD